MKSGLDAIPPFLLDDLLKVSNRIFFCLCDEIMWSISIFMTKTIFFAARNVHEDLLPKFGFRELDWGSFE